MPLNLVLVGVLLATCPISTRPRPVPFSQHDQKTAGKQWPNDEPLDESAFDDGLQMYLTEFGYLPKNNPEISNLRSDVAISNAISRLQEYAGLNVTSKLDEQTKRLIKSARCGMADIQYDGSGGRARHKRYTIFGEKWQQLRLTFKVVSHSPYMDMGHTRRAVHDALKLWSDASALVFVETSDDGADILIEFLRRDHGDSYPFDGRNVVLAHAFFPGSGRGGDAHFDDDEIWTHLPASTTLHDYEKVNFFTVAAHEFGHSLGLGHSRDRNALMFAYYKDHSQIAQLPYDDTLAIQQLYGVGKVGVPVAPPPTTERPTPATHPPLPTHAPAPPSVTTPRPDACHSEIDAVARIRHEVFVFKGSYFWRYNDDGAITSDPVEISRFWQGFPHDLDSVDAVFERPIKDTIVFFKGRKYWEFRDNYVLPGFPKDIGSLGLTSDVSKIDAAFVWAWAKKPYLFTGDKYWRLSDDLTVEHDYPRKLNGFWADVPSNVDAAFTDKMGSTYFFKNSQVYKFNDYFSRVDRNYPVKIGDFWAQCRASNRNMQLPSSKDHQGNGGVSIALDANKVLLSTLFLLLLHSEL